MIALTSSLAADATGGLSLQRNSISSALQVASALPLSNSPPAVVRWENTPKPLDSSQVFTSQPPH